MIRIEIEGGGTIANATRWSSTARLNAGGSFSFSMPASDPAAALVVPLAVVSCYVDNVLVAMGIVDDIAVAGDQLTASGGDMSRELALRTLEVNIPYASAQVVVYSVGFYLPAGWTFVNQVSTTSFYLQVKVLRDSYLNLVATVCEMGGFWFTIDGRTLTISESANAVVEGPVVVGLRQATAASDVVNKVYVYGAGDGSAALTLKGATATLPAGYALDLAASAITHTASPYPLREKRVDLKQIGPLANTDAGVLEAKNALVIAGYQALKSMIAPVVTYDATVLWTGRLLPLQRLRITHKSDALAVDATLVITEVTVRATAEGVVTSAVTLQADGRRVPGDAEVVAGAIRAARVGVGYPQLTTSNDTIVLAADLDSVLGDTVNFPLTIGSDVTQVKRIMLALDAAARPTDNAYGYSAPLPSAYQVRLNGAGAWQTYTGPMDLTALLVGSTDRPLQSVNAINVRGVANSNTLLFPRGVTTPAMPAHPDGPVQILEPSVSGKFGLWGTPSGVVTWEEAVALNYWLRADDAWGWFANSVQYVISGVTTDCVQYYLCIVKPGGTSPRYVPVALKDTTDWPDWQWIDPTPWLGVSTQTMVSNAGFACHITATLSLKQLMQSD